VGARIDLILSVSTTRRSTLDRDEGVTTPAEA
jgi:hypothetical protein